MEIVNGANRIEEVRTLIEEYTHRLGRDLSFQHIEEELRDPARKYTAPNGELLAAQENGVLIGIVAYHRHSDVRCEMKRLYVSSQFRGKGVGELLARAIIAHAKQAGFQEMVLDTITPLNAAIHLYEKLGFTRCAPYYDNPMADVIYMRKSLESAG